VDTYEINNDEMVSRKRIAISLIEMPHKLGGSLVRKVYFNIFIKFVSKIA